MKYPLNVISAKDPEKWSTIGTFRLTTSLDRESKGINMSRLMEQLHSSYQEGLSDRLPDLVELTRQLAEQMNQPKAELKVTYPWFYERAAPVTGLPGLNHSLASITVGWEAGKSPVIGAGLIYKLLRYARVPRKLVNIVHTTSVECCAYILTGNEENCFRVTGRKNC